MADYYTQFSCVLNLGTSDNVDRALQIFRPDSETSEDKSWYGISVEPSPDHGPGHLWIHDDGAGDVEEVIEFVQQCGRTFGLTGRWGFQYANICSKPRLDAFGGGAHVLDLATGDTVAWISTDEWLAGAKDAGDPA